MIMFILPSTPTYALHLLWHSSEQNPHGYYQTNGLGPMLEAESFSSLKENRDSPKAIVVWTVSSTSIQDSLNSVTWASCTLYKSLNFCGFVSTCKQKEQYTCSDRNVLMITWQYLCKGGLKIVQYYTHEEIISITQVQTVAHFSFYPLSHITLLENLTNHTNT